MCVSCWSRRNTSYVYSWMQLWCHRARRRLTTELTWKICSIALTTLRLAHWLSSGQIDRELMSWYKRMNDCLNSFWLLVSAFWLMLCDLIDSNSFDQVLCVLCVAVQCTLVDFIQIDDKYFSERYYKYHQQMTETKWTEFSHCSYNLFRQINHANMLTLSVKFLWRHVNSVW